MPVNYDCMQSLSLWKKNNIIIIKSSWSHHEVIINKRLRLWAVSSFELHIIPHNSLPPSLPFSLPLVPRMMMTLRLFDSPGPCPPRWARRRETSQSFPRSSWSLARTFLSPPNPRKRKKKMLRAIPITQLSETGSSMTSVTSLPVSVLELIVELEFVLES